MYKPLLIAALCAFALAECRAHTTAPVAHVRVARQSPISAMGDMAAVPADMASSGIKSFANAAGSMMAGMGGGMGGGMPQMPGGPGMPKIPGMPGR